MKKTVMLDGGHGGKDPGAVANGLNEKDIVLQLVKETAAHLERSGVKVLFTRATDVFIELSERARMANKADVDAFISFHINATARSEVNGYESFCYKFKYRQLADCIHKEVAPFFPTDRKVKEADYAVLRETDMAATLLEFGFITNLNDMKIVKNNTKAIAEAVAKGICNYLEVKYVPVKVETTDTRRKGIKTWWYKHNSQSFADIEKLLKERGLHYEVFYEEK